MNKRIISLILSVFFVTIFCLPTFAMADPPETIEAETYPPITPDGNMTVTDDLYQLIVEKIIQTGEDGTQVIESNVIENKQFITVHTRSGAEFYIIIDRSQDANNVYFLNQVDDDDLFALLEAEDSATPCTCEEKCAAGAVNTDCYVCRMNMKSCVGKETVKPEKTANTEPITEKPTEKKSSILPLIFIVSIAGFGAIVYFIKFKKKPKTSGTIDLDDYDYNEEDDEFEDEGYESENEEDSNTNE